jgi:hypothetical protein
MILILRIRILSSDHNIVSMYQCDNCDTWYEVFHDKKETNGDERENK